MSLVLQARYFDVFDFPLILFSGLFLAFLTGILGYAYGTARSDRGLNWAAKALAKEDVLKLTQLQMQLAPWVRHNFGQQRPTTLQKAYQPLTGLTEELGELCHAHLKQDQGIRGEEEEHEAAGQDAVGDIVIYLADYCNARGWWLDEIVTDTWNQVKERDWQANSKTGT